MSSQLRADRPHNTVLCFTEQQQDTRSGPCSTYRPLFVWLQLLYNTLALPMPDVFFFTSGCPVISGNAACLPFHPRSRISSHQLVVASLLFPSRRIVVLKASSAPQTSLPRLAMSVNVYPRRPPLPHQPNSFAFAFPDSGCLDPVQIDPVHRSSARQIVPPPQIQQ